MTDILSNEAEMPSSPIRNRKRPTTWNGWTVFSSVVAALVAIPVLVILGYIFSPGEGVWSHLFNTVLPGYILNTILLMLGVGLITFTAGTTAAWLVTMCRFPGRRFFEWALLLPLAVPSYAIAFAYFGLFEFAGPVQGFIRSTFDLRPQDYWFPQIASVWGAAFVMGMVLYPYVYMLARAAFLEQSVCVLEVSRTLGCSSWQSFRRVALPLARPAIATGVALALMETLSDFGVVSFFAVDTFTTGIYRTWLSLGDVAAASQLASILLLFIFGLVLLERHGRGQAKFHHTTARYRPLPGYQLTGMRSLLAVVACFMPLFLGFLLPAATLLKWALDVMDAEIYDELATIAWNSVLVAGIAAVVVVCIAMLMAYGQRLARTRIGVVASRIAALGYAVPGSVIAVGVMVPFAYFDNTLDAFMRQTFGISTGLLLSGTMIALVFAYVVRFLAVAFNAADNGLAKVTPNMDRAARSLGCNPGGVLSRVHIPIIKGSLLTALLLVFVDVMKELPATLILRPFNFNTLAVRAYELASDDRLYEAAGPALLIVVFGVLPVIILSRAITASRPGQH